VQTCALPISGDLQPAQLRKTTRGKRPMGGFLAAQAGAPEETRGMTRAQQVARERQPIKKAALILGPGFITGAADDDPSGIGTYSVAGASLGLATLWTALITFPFMAAVQNICARLGQVSGSGLAGILKEHYPRWVLYPAVALVVVATVVAILGTTISPYLFFWQTSQEVEEEKSAGRRKRAQRRGASRFELKIATIDVTVGMWVSNVVMYFIILATALTLHANGKTDISTGADAAEALKPLAGNLAGVIFAVGMIGTGLLAVPVLSGASAYAVSETFGWREGLDEDWWRARPFYGVVALATLVGLVIPFTGVKPIDALFFTSVLNGVAAPFLLVVIMLVARNTKVMGQQTIGPVLTVLGWTVTIAMFVALLGLAMTSFGS